MGFTTKFEQYIYNNSAETSRFIVGFLQLKIEGYRLQIISIVNPCQKAIIVSGFSESDRVRQAQALGAGAYVRKPYMSETLGMAVRKELDKV